MLNVLSYIKGAILNIRGGKETEKLIKELYSAETSLIYKKLAVNTCVNIIANAFLACEFLTYQNGKEKRGEAYYLLNVKPNQNESASAFFKRVISTLLKENECLVVNVNGMLYIADDYSVEEYALFDNVYKNVVIGSLTLDRVFYEKDVFHFKLNDESIKKVIDTVYDDYKALLSIAWKAYKTKSTQRLLFEGDALWSMDDKTKTERDNFFKNTLKNWLSSDGGVNVLGLPKGLTLREWTDSTGNSSRQADSRDIKNLINDIYEFVTSAYHVPISIVKGDKLDIKSEVDSAIMFAVRPAVKVVEDEINAKYYTKKDFLQRNYMRIDLSKIKLLDLTALANAADKLRAAGINTINDSLRMLDREETDEPCANERVITKNYGAVNALTEGDTING